MTRSTFTTDDAAEQVAFERGRDEARREAAYRRGLAAGRGEQPASGAAASGGAAPQATAPAATTRGATVDWNEVAAKLNADLAKQNPRAVVPAKQMGAGR